MTLKSQDVADDRGPGCAMSTEAMQRLKLGTRRHDGAAGGPIQLRRADRRRVGVVPVRSSVSPARSGARRAAAARKRPEISRIERGLGNPARDALNRLATALHAHLTLVPDDTATAH